MSHWLRHYMLRHYDGYIASWHWWDDYSETAWCRGHWHYCRIEPLRYWLLHFISIRYLSAIISDYIDSPIGFRLMTLRLFEADYADAISFRLRLILLADWFIALTFFCRRWWRHFSLIRHCLYNEVTCTDNDIGHFMFHLHNTDIELIYWLPPFDNGHWQFIRIEGE